MYENVTLGVKNSCRFGCHLSFKFSLDVKKYWWFFLFASKILQEKNCFHLVCLPLVCMHVVQCANDVFISYCVILHVILCNKKIQNYLFLPFCMLHAAL